MTIEEVHQLISTRRSVYPAQYIDKEIPRAVLQKALENANTAPTHKLTQPWRFRVMHGQAKKRFGLFMSEKYRSITPLEAFSIGKYEKLKMNPQKAGALIAICMQRDPKQRVPEWEEVAAVSMAVENMWLTLHAYGVGSYWSTPDLLEYFGEFEELNEGEICLGIFYAGYYSEVLPAAKKQPVDELVKWLD